MAVLSLLKQNDLFCLLPLLLYWDFPLASCLCCFLLIRIDNLFSFDARNLDQPILIKKVFWTLFAVLVLAHLFHFSLCQPCLYFGRFLQVRVYVFQLRLLPLLSLNDSFFVVHQVVSFHSSHIFLYCPLQRSRSHFLESQNFLACASLVFGFHCCHNWHVVNVAKCTGEILEVLIDFLNFHLTPMKCIWIHVLLQDWFLCTLFLFGLKIVWRLLPFAAI